MHLTPTRSNDFSRKQEQGSLPFSKTLNCVERSYKRVPWTYSADGLLRDGCQVMLRNKKVNGHLAMDVSSAQPGVEGACRLSVSCNN